MSGPLRSLKSGRLAGTHASLLIYQFQILLIPTFRLEFKVRVESTLRDLRKCHRDYCREFLDPTKEDYDEMGRAYEVEVATFISELE